jgi:pilus assembly protein CpaE
VDAGSAFDARPLEALHVADLVLLVGIPTVPAARSLRLTAEMLAELGLPRERLRLVLNRWTKRGGISAQDLESSIGLPIAWCIAADDANAREAVNRGVPAILSARRSDLGRSISALAGELATITASPPAVPPAEAAA